MANKTMGISEELAAYVVEVGAREPEVLARLREETAAIPEHGMQIAPEEGAFLPMLAELTGSRRYIEIGTFTGYSSTAVALRLPEDGRMVCCDVSEKWTSVARKYWEEAGVSDKIDLLRISELAGGPRVSCRAVGLAGVVPLPRRPGRVVIAPVRPVCTVEVAVAVAAAHLEVPRPSRVAEAV